MHSMTITVRACYISYVKGTGKLYHCRYIPKCKRKRYTWDHFTIINWYDLSEFIRHMEKPTDAALKLSALAQYLYFHSWPSHTFQQQTSALNIKLLEYWKGLCFWR